MQVVITSSYNTCITTGSRPLGVAAQAASMEHEASHTPLARAAEYILSSSRKWLSATGTTSIGFFTGNQH